jgi:hypothetical protein
VAGHGEGQDALSKPADYYGMKPLKKYVADREWWDPPLLPSSLLTIRRGRRQPPQRVVAAPETLSFVSLGSSTGN